MKKKLEVVIDEATGKIKIDKRIGLKHSIKVGGTVGAVAALGVYLWYRLGISEGIFNTLKSIDDGVLTIEGFVKEEVINNYDNN